MSDVRHAPDPQHEWVSQVLLRVEVGSTAHGTGLPGHEDYDEIGIMAQPWRETIGISPGRDTITYRPGRGPSDRSGPDDYDLTVHTARKFAQLATKGNPSILMVLFGPVRHTTEVGDQLRTDDMIRAFWHVGARQRFLGYAQSQRQRLTGERGGAHTNRPELVAAHGYDTKYAMHMLRLGLQGLEFALTGRIQLPMRPNQREFLQAVRRGEVPLTDVLRHAEQNEIGLKTAHQFEPDFPDVERVNQWLHDVHDWCHNAP